MPQSLALMYVHLVFSTKGRVPFLRDPDLRSEVHSYLGGISGHLGCTPLIAGGVDDHVHLLVRFGKQITLAQWIGKLKTASNSRIKDSRPELRRFKWQIGYGAFSVEPRRVEEVRAHIADQAEHHKKVSFQDELRSMLRECGIEPDEEHLWD